MKMKMPKKRVLMRWNVLLLTAAILLLSLNLWARPENLPTEDVLFQIRSTDNMATLQFTLGPVRVVEDDGLIVWEENGEFAKRTLDSLFTDTQMSITFGDSSEGPGHEFKNKSVRKELTRLLRNWLLGM